MPHLEVVAACREDALVDGELVLTDNDVDVAKRRRLTQFVESSQRLQSIKNYPQSLSVVIMKITSLRNYFFSFSGQKVNALCYNSYSPSITDIRKFLATIHNYTILLQNQPTRVELKGYLTFKSSEVA